VLSGRGLCDELITRPEESYRLWCVVVWSRKPQEWGGHDPRWVAAPQQKNSCYAYLLMIYFVQNRCIIMWTFSAINLLVLWRCSCSWSVKVCVESVSYIYCSFWGPIECSTADICCGMTGSMNLWSFLENRRIVCCSFKTCADVTQ